MEDIFLCHVPAKTLKLFGFEHDEGKWKIYFFVTFQQRHLSFSILNMMKINLMLFNKISVMTRNPL